MLNLVSVSNRTRARNRRKKLSLSVVGDRKKLRRLSRMRYHDLTKVAVIIMAAFLFAKPLAVSDGVVDSYRTTI